jgi:F-type H+-transporting ATPase subunit b
MLSRLARASTLAKHQSLIYRSLASANSNSVDSPAPVKRYPHDAPERDFVNFPPLRIPENGGKLRIGLVPDEWFKALYEKTGVTGPYVLFWGLVATVLSKEYFVFWVDSAEQIVFLAAVVAISKFYGKNLADFLDKQVEVETKKEISKLNDATKEISLKIEQNQKLGSLPEANTLVNLAKKENVHLQLEASFRNRLNSVYQEIKKRLDYQVAVQGVYKRLERDQAINYILSQVNKSIGSNQEKEAFQSGLNALKNLSKKHAGSI